MKSKIEWTDKTWNPITGCTKYSSGCVNCYAEMMARRLKAMGIKKYENGFSITLHEECLEEPLRWKGSNNVFVCSMSEFLECIARITPYCFLGILFFYSFYKWKKCLLILLIKSWKQ